MRTKLLEDTHEVCFKSTSCRLLIHCSSALTGRLLNRFDLAEILLHALELSIYSVVLHVCAL